MQGEDCSSVPLHSSFDISGWLLLPLSPFSLLYHLNTYLLASYANCYPLVGDTYSKLPPLVLKVQLTNVGAALQIISVLTGF